ncbi:MAG: GNAT family N-acetyltransferase [Fimbriimonas sp.]|nr:GNAT family N-acetyltransferase [Fimbriimonas sp.]
MAIKGLRFELAERIHARAIEEMRRHSAIDLTARLGGGHWSGFTRLPSIRERILNADPANLRRLTLYVACIDHRVIGSVAVSTFPPGFWHRSYWQDPSATALGVFNLVVYPEYQRQGFGRFIMCGVEDLAREMRIPFVRLDAYSDNPISNSFYRSIGYEVRREIEVRLVGLTLFEKPVLATDRTGHPSEYRSHG